MAPQLPASALAAISGYVDREEPAGPPAPAAAPPVPAPALDREEPAAPPPGRTARAPAGANSKKSNLWTPPPSSLLHPDGPGYAVVDGVLGQAARRAAARRPRPEQLKRARVGRGDARRLSRAHGQAAFG